jgi:hypothetical protein
MWAAAVIARTYPMPGRLSSPPLAAGLIPDGRGRGYEQVGRYCLFAGRGQYTAR